MGLVPKKTVSCGIRTRHNGSSLRVWAANTLRPIARGLQSARILSIATREFCSWARQNAMQARRAWLTPSDRALFFGSVSPSPQLPVQ